VFFVDDCDLEPVSDHVLEYVFRYGCDLAFDDLVYKAIHMAIELHGVIDPFELDVERTVVDMHLRLAFPESAITYIAVVLGDWQHLCHLLMV